MNSIFNLYVVRHVSGMDNTWCYHVSYTSSYMVSQQWLPRLPLMRSVVGATTTGMGCITMAALLLKCNCCCSDGDGGSMMVMVVVVMVTGARWIGPRRCSEGVRGVGGRWVGKWEGMVRAGVWAWSLPSPLPIQLHPPLTTTHAPLPPTFRAHPPSPPEGAPVRERGGVGRGCGRPDSVVRARDVQKVCVGSVSRVWHGPVRWCPRTHPFSHPPSPQSPYNPPPQDPRPRPLRTHPSRGHINCVMGTFVWPHVGAGPFACGSLRRVSLTLTIPRVGSS